MPEMADSAPARVTIHTLARELGVSPATVSLVLRQKPGVGEETRRRVLEAAARRGYSPRRHGRAADSPRVRTVAALVKARPGDPPQANEFYAHVMVGIEAACREQRINLLWGTVLVDDHNRPLELPALVDDGAADALLVIGMELAPPLRDLLRRGFPALVLVDSYLAEQDATGSGRGSDARLAGVDSVLADNRAGAALAAALLHAQGHRHIALLGGEPGAYPSLRARGLGVQETLAAHPEVTLYCEPTCDTMTEAGARFGRLLQGNPQITACIGVNDLHAIAALRAAEALGRIIPRDLAVVGFDGIDRGEHMTPSLTTIYIDKVKMGRLAVQVLLERVADPAGAPVTVTVQGRLVERASTGSQPVR